MTVLSSEDEIEELASELVDVAKVTEHRTLMQYRCHDCKIFTLLTTLQSEKNGIILSYRIYFSVQSFENGVLFIYLFFRSLGRNLIIFHGTPDISSHCTSVLQHSG